MPSLPQTSQLRGATPDLTYRDHCETGMTQVGPVWVTNLNAIVIAMPQDLVLLSGSRIRNHQSTSQRIKRPTGRRTLDSPVAPLATRAKKG